MITLDPFYPIVHSTEWVERLLKAGAVLVQLRVKARSPAHVQREIRAALSMCTHHGAQLVVNDYWELALREGATCVHLGQGDLVHADLPALRAHGVRIGVSTHDDAELQLAREISPDYIALGPIYPTSLKVMPWQPQGLAQLTKWKSLIGTTSLVAIGGLTLERVAGCLDAGADCVAVVSDIVMHADPEARARAWQAATADRRALVRHR